MTRRVYRIEIPATPRPKQRPRHTAAGRTFTPKETVNAEAWTRMCCTQQVGTPLVAGPVMLRVAFVMPIPNSMPKQSKLEAVGHYRLPTTKPDWDNLAKLTADALNGIAWRDDAHVTVAEVAKFYGQDPRTIVTWWQMAPEECAAAAVRFGVSTAAGLF